MSSVKRSRFIKGGIISGVGLIIIAIMALLLTVTIKPGYAGIVYNMSGGIQKNTLGQGWHVIWPSQHAVAYPVSLTTVWMSKNGQEGSDKDESFGISTSDGKPVTIDASFTYAMDVKNLPWIYTNFKGEDSTEIENTFMKAQLKADINKVSSTYSISDIYGTKRDEVAQKALAVFTADMANYHIIVSKLGITAVTPDNDTMKAIQDKVNAEQALQKAKITQQQTQVDAQTAVIKAQGDADAKVASAQGEAKANAALNSNLTSELIQYKSLQVQQSQADAMSKWNVNTFVNGGSTPLLNIPENTTQPKK